MTDARDHYNTVWDLQWFKDLPARKVESIPSILTAPVHVSLELQQLDHTLQGTHTYTRSHMQYVAQMHSRGQGMHTQRKSSKRQFWALRYNYIYRYAHVSESYIIYIVVLEVLFDAKAIAIVNYSILYVLLNYYENIHNVILSGIPCSGHFDRQPAELCVRGCPVQYKTSALHTLLVSEFKASSLRLVPYSSNVYSRQSPIYIGHTNNGCTCNKLNEVAC